MEAKLQEDISKLPVVQKAHIYEPKIEDVSEISFKAGIREVVEQVESFCPVIKQGQYGEIWQALKKDWGI